MISVKNITKRFGSKLVLDNVSLDVKEGEIFGLIGPNGAGKSTLLNIITGLVEKDNGTIKYGDIDFEKEPLKCKEILGLVPQNLAIIKEVSAEDNLAFFGAYYGLQGKVLKERIDEALDIIGLKEKRKEKASKYSGGMLRRLNLGIAIMHHPKLLILDEPTVGVDAQSRNYIFDYLKKINRELNTTIIYTSHYMEEVEALCDRIFILDEGKEVAFGTKNEIKRLAGERKNVNIILDSESDLTEELKSIFSTKKVEKKSEIYTLSFEETLNIEDIIKTIHANGLKIKSISIEEAKLEEIFLMLTGKNLRD